MSSHPLRTRLLAVLAAALLPLALAACENTGEGIQEDLQEIDEGVDVDVDEEVVE